MLVKIKRNKLGVQRQIFALSCDNNGQKHRNTLIFLPNFNFSSRIRIDVQIKIRKYLM